MGGSTVSYQMRGTVGAGRAGKSSEPPSGTPAETHEEGITPAVEIANFIPVGTNFSVGPGYAWMELQNATAITVATGPQTITAEIPARFVSAPLFMGYLSQPIAVVVLPPLSIPTGGVPDSGMSAQGFPSLPKAISRATAGLPATLGIRWVTMSGGPEEPPSKWDLDVSFVGTGGTIAAKTRWLFITMTGV